MNKMVAFIFLFQLLTIYGCNLNSRELQEKTTKNFSVSEFSKLDVSHAFKVIVKVGESSSLKITADESVIDDIEVQNKENTLILSLDSFMSNVGSIEAEITVTELKELDASGACDISIVGVSTQKFETDISGACKAEISGEVKKLEADISGASRLRAENLKCEDVEIELSGASSAEVYASSSIEAEASGASNLIFYGDPENVETDVSGASNIKSK